jgi:hypothetical protein
MLSKIGFFCLLGLLFCLLGISATEGNIIKEWKKNKEESNFPNQNLRLISKFQNRRIYYPWDNTLLYFFQDFREEDENKFLESIKSYDPYKKLAEESSSLTITTAADVKSLFL